MNFKASEPMKTVGRYSLEIFGLKTVHTDLIGLNNSHCQYHTPSIHLRKVCNALQLVPVNIIICI